MDVDLPEKSGPPDIPSADQPKSRPDYKQRFILAGHRRAVSSLKFSPDGTLLASACKFSGARV